MAAYSDTTKRVLALALERLTGEVPEQPLAKLRELAESGRLQDLDALEAALSADLEDAHGNR